ncbi:hypothetical protein [Moraxella oculi]|uniref:Uncharacterized protein n=1 Tax=Moraxella oculi TaxID=2940516 RepID=A0ABW8U777_9GAMM
MLFLIGRIASAVIEKRLEEERRAREEEKRRRFFTCDECGKEEALVKGEVEEIDRYPTYKELRETTSSGKTKTRQVKIFKVTEKTHYRCKFCDAGFTTTNTRELN